MRRHGWAWLAVGVVAGAAAVVPAHHLTHVTPISRGIWAAGGQRHARDVLFRDLAIWWALFAVTAVALLRAPRRAAVAAALVLGVAASVAALAPTAVLSDDVYRYAWDGKVQAAGIDPYRYAANDPHLDRLHDRWLWPADDQCAGLGKVPPCTRINRAGAHTIYPPAAQLWFRAAHVVVPAHSRDRGWQVLGLVVATLTAALLAAALALAGRDPRYVVLWSCCPVVALEAVQSAHVDAVAALAVAAAAAVALRTPPTASYGRESSSRRPLLAAALVAAATLVKLYPLVLLPALVQRRRRVAWPLAVALVAVAYVPYVVDVGGKVTGYLHGYLQQEGYASGSRFVLLTALRLPTDAAKVVAVFVVVVVTALAVARRLGPPVVAALAVFATVLLVATPGEPWYDLVLVVLVALTGRWEWLGIVLAEYVGYLTALLGPHHVGTSQLAYAVALVVGLAVTALRAATGTGTSTADLRRAGWST